MMSRSRTTRVLALALGLAGLTSLLFALAPSPARAQASGRDAFAREPKTPLETWEVVSYLIRVGEPGQAARYVKSFVDSKPDDDALLEVRDRYGVGSILRLSDYPETQPYARTLAEMIAAASSRHATDQGRIDRFVGALSKSRPEQDYAVEQLREAGPYAVPSLVRALSVANLDPSIRTPLVENAGKLDRRAVPALIAALDSPDDQLVADVAMALGQIGDARAIPALTYLAVKANPPSAARATVRGAILELTGRSFESQPRTPVRVLADEARKYHLHAYRFPGDPVVVWVWDASNGAPAPASMPVRDAEGVLGLRAAGEALELDPTDAEAKIYQLSLGLERDPAAWKAAALASGPDILGRVVRRAIADGRNDLAATAIGLLAQVTDRDSLLKPGAPKPLVEALSAPDRRVQLAAAEALVGLEPKGQFLGCSLVAPILSRFALAQPLPRAIVVDGNPERASQAAGFLRSIGYDSRVSPTGAIGFARAVDGADVELIVVSPTFVNDSWRLPDLLGNLKADPRTAGIPVFVVGPLSRETLLAPKLESFPDVQFLMTPTETKALKRQIDRSFARLGVRPMTAAERADLARKATSLLARIGATPDSPFAGELIAAEPSLSMAIHGPFAPIESAMALGGIPGTDAQRALADVMLDLSKSPEVRVASAQQLARHVRRFGPKLDRAQERRLVVEFNAEADPSIRDALAAVVGALTPHPDASVSARGSSGLRVASP